MIILYIIIFLLLLIIILLLIGFLFLLKKTKYITNTDKEFIKFTIDMYIEYAKELEIHSEKQHEKIVKQLEKIKKRYFEK